MASIIGSLISATFGLGGGIIMLSILVLFFDAKFAIPVHAIVMVISNFGRIIVFRKYIDLKILKFTVIGAIPGAIFGATTFKYIPKDNLQFLIGIIIIIFIIYNYVKPEKTQKFHKSLFIPIGIIFGVISGILGAVGPVISTFLVADGLMKQPLVATHSSIALITDLFKILTYIKHNLITFEGFYIGIIVGCIGILGTLLGEKILKYIDQALYKKIVFIILFILSIKFMFF